MADENTASRIADTLLRRALKALKTNDFELFRSCYLLPVAVDTFEGRIVIETEADLRRRFQHIRLYHRTKNITDLVRHCVEIEFRDAQTVTATHTYRLLSDVQLVGQPLSVFTVFTRTDGVWHIGSSQYAFDRDPGLNAALIGPPADHLGGRHQNH